SLSFAPLSLRPPPASEGVGGITRRQSCSHCLRRRSNRSNWARSNFTPVASSQPRKAASHSHLPWLVRPGASVPASPRNRGAGRLTHPALLPFGTVVPPRDLIIIAALVLACAIAVRLSAGQLLAPDMQHLIETWLHAQH